MRLLWTKSSRISVLAIWHRDVRLRRMPVARQAALPMTKGGPEVWKERYALKPRTPGGELQHAYGHIGAPVYHHEHPFIEGAAHCHSTWQLDMATLKEVQPTNYCKRCMGREWSWGRTRGEEAPKTTRSGNA